MGPWRRCVLSGAQDAGPLCGRTPARSPVHQLKDRHVGGLLVWALRMNPLPGERIKKTWYIHTMECQP